MRPREALAKLVQYFRGFTDSDEPPHGQGNPYLDLALSKKGVCRHRAYAFLVTAQSLGIPTRLVDNEAHAWVEVHDGTLWRRIDLGGAGRMASPTTNQLARREPYAAPGDAFPWPRNAKRGDEMIVRPPPGSTAGGANFSSGTSSVAGADGPPPLDPPANDTGDARPRSTVTLTTVDPVVHRGVALHLHGVVQAGGQPCPHVTVDVTLREPAGARSHAPGASRSVLLGTLATGDDGVFDGSVIPSGVPLGDYDLEVTTRGGGSGGSGDGCGRGAN
jgi:hypothetical protein